MASNLQFVITNAGLQAVANAQGGGPAVNITSFQVGTAYNYSPTASMTSLQGTSLYSGLATGYSVDSLNQVTYILKMDQTVGTFNFGEVGLYLSSGTLFALASFASLQEKVAASSSNAGNLVTLVSRLLLTGIAPTISFTNVSLQNAILLEVSVPDGLPVPNAANSSNVYSVQSGDDTSRPIIAIRETAASQWGFNTHVPYLSGTVSSVASTTQTNISAINATQFDFATNRFLVQFTSGQNAGSVRAVASIANGLITHTALPYAANTGDAYIIYRSLASMTNQFTQKTVYGVDSGSANNYVVTSTNTTSNTLRDGMSLTFVPVNSSTSSCMLAYNGNPAIAVKKAYAGQELATTFADFTGGVASTVTYSLSQNVWLLKDPANYALLNGDPYQPFTAQKLTITGLNDANGSELVLQGNGTTAPTKTVRAYGGNFQVINNAYTAAILTLDDSGNLTVPGNFSGKNGTFSGTLQTYGSATFGTTANNGGAAFPAFQSGMHATWNHTNGSGETDLVAYQGAGGTGGFNFYNQNSGGVATLLATLNQTSGFVSAYPINVPAITANGLTINGSGAVSGTLAVAAATANAQAVNLGQLNQALNNLNNNSIVANLQNIAPELTTYTPTGYSVNNTSPGTAVIGNAPRGWVYLAGYYADSPFGASAATYGLLVTRNSNGDTAPTTADSNNWFHQEFYGTNHVKYVRYNINGVGWGSWHQIAYIDNLTNGLLTVNFAGLTSSSLTVNGNGSITGNLNVNGAVTVGTSINTNNGNITAVNSAEARLIAINNGQPAAYLFNNGNQWGLYSSAGGTMCEWDRPSSKFAFNGAAATLGQGGNPLGTQMTFNWAGQGGQPTWLWGSNDGQNIYVWNPSNFNVNYASSAGSVNGVNNPAWAGSVCQWNTGQVNFGLVQNDSQTAVPAPYVLVNIWAGGNSGASTANNIYQNGVQLRNQ